MDLEAPNSTNQPPQGENYDDLVPPETMGGPNSSPAYQPPPPPPTPPAYPVASPAQPTESIPPVEPAGQVPPANIPSVTAGSNLRSYLMVGFLILLLLAALGVFASWNGWIPIGAGLWGKTTPTPSATASVEPTTSPIATNDETRKQDLANIAVALKAYNADNSKYPESAVMIKTSDPQSILAQALVPTYLAVLPDDPATPTGFYGYKSDGKTFELTAALDDKTDSTGVLEGTLNIYRLTELSSQ